MQWPVLGCSHICLLVYVPVVQLVELMQALVTDTIKQRIVYSEKYSDDAYEYR